MVRLSEIHIKTIPQSKITSYCVYTVIRTEITSSGDSAAISVVLTAISVVVTAVSVVAAAMPVVVMLIIKVVATLIVVPFLVG